MFIGDGKKPRTGNDSWQARIARIDEYVTTKNDWTQDDLIRFIALSLCGEAGELANKIKKQWRTGKPFTKEELIEIGFEIADVRMLTHRLAVNLEINEDVACDEKLDEFNKRFQQSMGWDYDSDEN